MRRGGGPLISAPGTVVTVGVFDGVHRGHMHVLQTLEKTAERLGLRSVVVTFDPHPLEVLRPESAPALLSTKSEKIEVLAVTGVNYAVVLRFDRELADYPPERFVEEILIGRLAMRHLVIGYDHGFGRGRSGDVETLRSIGRRMGFGVDVVAPVAEVGEAVSSTRIRRLLEQGDVVGAARCLGRPYSLRGCVIRGDGRGTALGFPTANLALENTRKLVPRPGIYAVRAELGAGPIDGVLHVGPRPTFPDAAPSIELHILDFRGELYGREITVRFCARLRDIERFDSVDALVAAMERDVERAELALRGLAGACAETVEGVTVNG